MLPGKAKKILFSQARKISDWYKNESYDRLSISSCKIEKGVELKKYLPQTPDGLEIIPVKDIELMFHEKIAEIEDLVALGDSNSFDYFYGSTIRNFISYAHLLPASAGYHHEYPGGLVEHSLEVAKLSIEIAKSKYKIPASQYGDQDVIRYPRWIMAVFLNALFHDAGKFLMDMRVISDNGGHVWNPYLMDLVSWADYKNVEKYHIDFRHGRQLDDHRYLSNIGFQFAVPKHVLAFMEKTNDNLVLKVTQALMYQYRHDYMVDVDPNNINDVEDFIRLPVKQADQLSTYKSLITYVNRFFGPGRTSMLGMFIKILSVLRDRWEVNKKDSVVFTYEGDVYLHSPKFLFDVIDHASYHQLPFPKDHKIVMDELINRGVLVVNQGSCNYKLKPLYYKVRSYLTVVKLSNPAILFGQDPVFESPDTIVKTEFQFNKESGNTEEKEVIVTKSKEIPVQVESKVQKPQEPKPTSKPKKESPVVHEAQEELQLTAQPPVKNKPLRKRRGAKEGQSLNSINDVLVDDTELILDITPATQSKSEPENKSIDSIESKNTTDYQEKEIISFKSESTRDGNEMILSLIEHFKKEKYELEPPGEMFFYDEKLCIHHTKFAKRLKTIKPTEIPRLFASFGWVASAAGKLVVNVPYGKTSFKAIPLSDSVKESIFNLLGHDKQSLKEENKRSEKSRSKTQVSTEIKKQLKPNHEVETTSVKVSPSKPKRVVKTKDKGEPKNSSLSIEAWFYDLVINQKIRGVLYERETSEIIYEYPIKIPDPLCTEYSSEEIKSYLNQIYDSSINFQDGERQARQFAYYMDVTKHG